MKTVSYLACAIALCSAQHVLAEGYVGVGAGVASSFTRGFLSKDDEAGGNIQPRHHEPSMTKHTAYADIHTGWWWNVHSKYNVAGELVFRPFAVKSKTQHDQQDNDPQYLDVEHGNAIEAVAKVAYKFDGAITPYVRLGYTTHRVKVNFRSADGLFSALNKSFRTHGFTTGLGFSMKPWQDTTWGKKMSCDFEYRIAFYGKKKLQSEDNLTRVTVRPMMQHVSLRLNYHFGQGS